MLLPQGATGCGPAEVRNAELSDHGAGVSARAIFDSLQAVRGVEPGIAAREGFLEWAFALPLDCPPREAACAALCRIPAAEAETAAARAFLALLRDAALWPTPEAVRRGGRAGRLRLAH